MQRLVQCFLDTDMRCQHDGLAKIAKKQKVDLDTLSRGEHVVFINGKMNRVKMISHGGVLSYLRLKSGSRFELDTLRKIPEAFADGKSFDVVYSHALKAVLKEKLDIR